MITVSGWCEGGMGGVWKWGEEGSVNGGDGERLLSKHFPHFFGNIDRRSYNYGNRELINVISKLSPKMPTISFGGGLHFGVPCRGAHFGRVEL